MLKPFLKKIKKIERDMQIEGGSDDAGKMAFYTVYPRKKSSIAAIIKCANHQKIKIIPYSTGRNWGYASLTRPGIHAKDTVILNMCRMNKLNINEKYGFATIEPGVTQEQIITALLKKKSHYSLDPIGIFSNTSYLGNLLENGIASHTLRSETLVNAEFVTGRGDILTTGIQDDVTSVLNAVYPNSLGPSFKSLLQQSNIGIVTEATIKLTQKIDKSFIIAECPSDHVLTHLIKNINSLYNTDGFIGFSRIHDRNKFLSFLKAAHNNDQKDANKLENICQARWYAILSVHTKKKNAVIKTLQKIDKNIKTSADKVVITPKFRQKHLISTSFIKEAPSIALLNFNKIKNYTYDAEVSRTLDSTGLLFNSFVMPTDDKLLAMILKKIKIAEKKFRINILTSFNPVSDRLSYLILTLVFDKTEPKALDLSQNCHRYLSSTLVQKNIANYRLVHRDFHKISRNPKTKFYLRNIKKIFDPNGIINPGHYNV